MQQYKYDLNFNQNNCFGHNCAALLHTHIFGIRYKKLFWWKQWAYILERFADQNYNGEAAGFTHYWRPLADPPDFPKRPVGGDLQLVLQDY